jgi:dolichol-phosphate mannosyltransferase
MTGETDSASVRFSVIIPTYNEREVIQSTVDRCLNAVESIPSEVIVVDDDSPDETWRLVEESYQSDDVRVVRRTDETGLGTAVLRGVDVARGDTVAVIDADLQHPPEVLPTLLREIDDGADVAIGSRYTEGGGVENWPLQRKIVSLGATWLAKLVPSTRGLSDPMSGFFAARKSVVQNADLDPSGFKILLEVIAKCDYDTVAEVPYTFTERAGGESNLSLIEYVAFFEQTIRLSADGYGLDKYVASDRLVRAVEFTIVGGVGTVVNTLVFLGMYQLVGVHYMLAGVLAFLVALNVNFVGNWAVTFDQPSSGLFGKYMAFHATSVVGFLFYSLGLFVFLRLFEMPSAVGNIAAIGIGSVVNFLGADNVAFDSF